MTDIRKVTVLGTGVLGAQIAFQTAWSGFEVTAYDISKEALDQARQRFAGLVVTYEAEVKDAAGGKAAAIAYTLIETAKLNGVDPQAWLADTLARLPDHKITRIDELLPWRWANS